MATSENQGLQIALIIFVMLTIILSVTTFVFFRQADEASLRSKTDAAAAGKADADLRTAQTEMNELKRLMGVPEAAKLKEVQDLHEQDMKAYGPTDTTGEEKKFYRQALEYTATQLAADQAKLSAALLEIEKLKESNLAFETASQTQIAQAEAARAQAESTLATLQAEFADQLAAKQAEWQKMADDLAKKEQQIASTKADADKNVKEAQDAEKKSKEDLEIVTNKLEELDPTKGFEVADGEIRWVNQQSGRVWINLGRADGLRRQVRFSVYGALQNPGGEEVPKGGIEVTEILDEHFAEARILHDELSDPMVSGDMIYTPLWHPGRGEHFGLTGDIDVDGDSIDDREFIRTLIKMHGGTLDAEVDKEGKRTGTLSIDTRYLIMGKEPAEKAEHSKLVKEAADLGVRILALDKFLDQVGWKNKQPVIRFGRGGNALTSTLEEPDGGRPTASGNVSEYVKKRQPPAGKRKSAY